MTKKECLEICLRLWKWLAETGCPNKDDWPEWSCWGGDVPSMLHSCPCCHYAKPRARIDATCKECPLNGYAWDVSWSCDIYSPPYYPCEHSDSPYKLWHSFSIKPDNDDKRMYYASQMVSAIERALEDLE